MKRHKPNKTQRLELMRVFAAIELPQLERQRAEILMVEKIARINMERLTEEVKREADKRMPRECDGA